MLLAGLLEVERISTGRWHRLFSSRQRQLEQNETICRGEA